MIVWQNNVCKLVGNFVVKVAADSKLQLPYVVLNHELVYKMVPNVSKLDVKTGVIMLENVVTTHTMFVVIKNRPWLVQQTLCSVGMTLLNLLLALLKGKPNKVSMKYDKHLPRHGY